MLHHTLPCTLLLLAVCASTVKSADDWTVYQLADGKFSMTFPAFPEETLRRTPDGNMKYPLVQCKLNSAILGVSWMPKEVWEADDPQTMANHMLDGLKSVGDEQKVLFHNAIEFNGLVGADLAASVTNNGSSLYYRQRMLATEDHLIQILYVDGSRMPLEPWVGDMFFNSLLVKKAAPTDSAVTVNE
ncbi:MAG: hypothetical protein AAFU85_17120 [Planctomycetota bacterium]